MLSRECWLTIGGLDLRTFERYGWEPTSISQYAREKLDTAST
jgi:hypothetical protein